MKHYYDDNGLLDYTVSDRQLLYDMAVAFDIPGKTPKEGKELLKDVREMALEIQYDYMIRKDLLKIGGCLTVDEWRVEEEDTKGRTALKALFFDFIDQGYVFREFLLAAESARAEIIINMYDWDD